VGREKIVKKVWAWVCLTAAAGLMLVAGERRAVEAVALDSDNLAGIR
jgi:hypothetical protein